jgi:acyl-CoA synthetase (AMP-forming)/AMP-acid ligase II
MPLVPLPDELGERTVPELLDAAATTRAAHTALIAPGLGQPEASLSYAELSSLSGRLASFLSDRGVGKGDRVAILLDQTETLEAHLTYHASHKLGAINVPLNTRYVERELEFVLRFSDPAAVVFSGRSAGVLGQLGSAIDSATLVEAAREPSLGERFGDALEGPDLTHRVPVEEHEDADWVFTSGTTGNPKAVALTHANSVACGHESVHLWGLDSDSVYQSFAPFFTSTGCHTNLLPCLATSCTYVVEPEFHTRETVRRIRRHGTTSIFLVSGVIQLILDRVGSDELDAEIGESVLRRIAYGGQPMAAPFYRRVESVFGERYGLELVHLWGLTEGGTCGTLLPPDLHRDGVEKAGRYGLSIGNGGWNDWIRVRVAGDDDSDAGAGEVGEICVRAPSVMDRYVDEEQASAEALRGDWLHTGDMGVLDDDGFLYFVDRRKQMIRRGGLNISSAEVEGVVAQHPAVAEVAVVPKPNPILEQEVKAVVVPRDGMETSAEEIIEHCRGLLADYKVPVEVQFIEELPRNAMGRVVKGALTGEGSALQD